MSRKLEGATAVVTGGSQGMGRAICCRLAQEGARVAVIDQLSASETGEAVVEAGAEFWQCKADISEEGQVEAAFARLAAEFGSADALFNVAGVFARVPFLETPAGVWDQMMDVNARGTFLCSRAAASQMRPKAAGSIVNILSTAAVQAWDENAAYCASKGAALMLTRAMAVELGPYGITVNGIGPGTINTEMGASHLGSGDIASRELDRTPLGRLGEPEDIAEVAVFLAGNGEWVTGQVIYVDGGFLATALTCPPRS